MTKLNTQEIRQIADHFCGVVSGTRHPIQMWSAPSANKFGKQVKELCDAYDSAQARIEDLRADYKIVKEAHENNSAHAVKLKQQNQILMEALENLVYRISLDSEAKNWWPTEQAEAQEALKKVKEV